MKKIKYGILTEPDIGRCPSCQYEVALPRGMNLDMLQLCPGCGAWSYGYRWQADGGQAAAESIAKFRKALNE